MGGYFSKRRAERQKRTGTAISKMQSRWEQDRRDQIEKAEERIHVRARRLNEAALRVQSIRRGQLARREKQKRVELRAEQKQEANHDAARRIQNHVRSRALVKWVRIWSVAAQVIQWVHRGAQQRRTHLLRDLHLDEYQSCEVGPARLLNRDPAKPHRRNRQAARPCGVFRQWAAAARIVQRYWWGHRGRTMAWAVRCELSALHLQRVVRTLEPKAELLWRRRRHAVIVIQKRIRGHWQRLSGMGWHAKSTLGAERQWHVALSEKLRRSGLQAVWRGYWYRLKRHRAHARDVQTLLDILQRIGLMRHKNWLLDPTLLKQAPHRRLCPLSLDECAEVNGEWQIGGSADSFSPYPGFVNGWGMNPSSDRVLFVKACRSERHKWLKMKKALAMGAGFSRYHKDQAVTMVQAMYRGNICRRKMRRAALKDGPYIRKVLKTASLLRLWPKLHKLGCSWKRLKVLGERQLGGHVRVSWRPWRAIPWGLTSSDAHVLAELLRRCALEGDDVVLGDAKKRQQGHLLGMKTAAKERAAALEAIKHISRENVERSKAARLKHQKEKEKDRCIEQAAATAVAEATAAREEAFAEAHAALIARQAEEMLAAIEMLDETYGGSWRAVATNGMPSSKQWRSALQESMAMAAAVGARGDDLGDEVMDAAKALGLCNEHVDALALKVLSPFRSKHLPGLFDIGPDSPATPPGEPGAKHMPAAERRQLRALRKAMRTLPSLCPPGASSPGAESEISRLLSDLSHAEAQMGMTPWSETPSPPLQDKSRTEQELALAAIDAFTSPPPSQLEWGLAGPPARSMADSKFKPVGPLDSLLPHTVLIRQAKANCSPPLKPLPPNDISSAMELLPVVGMARPLTPLVTPPSSAGRGFFSINGEPDPHTRRVERLSMLEEMEQMERLAKLSAEKSTQSDNWLSEFTGTFEERVRQRDVKERRERLQNDRTIPRDETDKQDHGRDGSTWVELQASEMMSEWKVRQAAMLKCQQSDLRDERPRDPRMETRFCVTQLSGWLLRGDSRESVVELMRDWIHQEVDTEAAELLRGSEQDEYRMLTREHPSSWFDPAAETKRLREHNERTKMELEAVFGF